MILLRDICPIGLSLCRASFPLCTLLSNETDQPKKCIQFVVYFKKVVAAFHFQPQN